MLKPMGIGKLFEQYKMHNLIDILCRKSYVIVFRCCNLTQNNQFSEKVVCLIEFLVELIYKHT